GDRPRDPQPRSHRGRRGRGAEASEQRASRGRGGADQGGPARACPETRHSRALDDEQGGARRRDRRRGATRASMNGSDATRDLQTAIEALAIEMVPAVVAEARSEAEANARAILAKEITRALLREA